MHRIALVYFGRFKVPGLECTFAHYRKLIARFVQLECIELRAQALGDKSCAQQEAARHREGELLTSQMQCRPSWAHYLLDEGGRAMSTQEWSGLLGRHERVAFFLGGSSGLGTEILGSHPKISLGPQTLPHELTRVVLLEQLYRAASLRQNHPYHNGGVRGLAKATQTLGR